MSALTPGGLFVSGDFQGTFLCRLSIKTGLCAGGKRSISFNPDVRSCPLLLLPKIYCNSTRHSTTINFLLIFFSFPKKPHVFVCLHSPIRAWALLCSAPGVGTGSCKSCNRDPPGPQFKRNSWMRENYIQHQPEPALQEQSYGPFTMDHYRIRQSIRVKNDPYL